MLDQNTRLKVENALEGVLISAEIHKAFKQNAANLEKTRKYISHQLRGAEQEAMEMKKLAYQKGFEKGFIDVFSLVEPFFFEKKRLFEQLFEETNKKLEIILTKLWENDAVLLSILENTIKEYQTSKDSINKFTVILPLKQKHNNDFITKIKSILQSDTTEWLFHEEDRYIIKNNDQIIEFNQAESTSILKKYIHTQIDMQDWIHQFQNKFRAEFIQHLKQQMDEIKKRSNDDDNT